MSEVSWNSSAAFEPEIAFTFTVNGQTRLPRQEAAALKTLFIIFTGAILPQNFMD